MTRQLFRVASILLLSLVSLATTTFTPQARDGPLIPEPIVTVTPTVTTTATVTPDPTSTPVPPSPTITPTPTDQVIEYSAFWKIERSLLYMESIRLLNEYNLDPILVVSVIAAESGGDPMVVSYAGACGPMQVMWKPWFEYSHSDLCGSSWANLIVGMRILRGAIDIADGDLRYGLAYYNCSEESVHNDGCGSNGGLHYADDVLEFWYPRVRRTLAQLEE